MSTDQPTGSLKNNDLQCWIEHELLLPSPTNKIILPISGENVLLKRDDLIHPILSGNKFRKLIGFLNQYYIENKNKIESGGSLHSNFVHSLAFICFQLKINCKFYLYGYQKDKSFLTKDLNNWGISFEILSRQDFREQTFRFKISESVLYIPEGGNEKEAEIGVRKLIEELAENYNFQNFNIAVAVGTGTMLKFLQKNLSPNIFYIVCPVKSQNFKQINSDNIVRLKEPNNFAFGGYSQEMLEYIDAFYSINGIWLDPVYTGRLVFALDHNYQLTDPKKNTIILHTGGLQSWRFYLERWPNAERFLNIAELRKMIYQNFQ